MRVKSAIKSGIKMSINIIFKACRKFNVRIVLTCCTCKQSLKPVAILPLAPEKQTHG
ncbi:hypothetical protein AGR4C_Lc90128 [Agrobacterium tumefaciens str. Kerr 14]|uniref:Uncharacterized protein n=1 Tax=Agrobacterium tumefaciens str. Kerr 14 TaxID=1183424 RepID=A0A1S7S7F4_AGRTU|nr:hypothetical protein AGR4C_Lc90128 [Agrobacterium tumefaciens str. Kerr 14]